MVDRYSYLQELATAQATPTRVRIWENKNVLIHRNLSQDRGLTTQVWDAWLRQALRPFGGFEEIIEIDTGGDKPDIKFFSMTQLADAVHYILHRDGALAVS